MKRMRGGRHSLAESSDKGQQELRKVLQLSLKTSKHWRHHSTKPPLSKCAHSLPQLNSGYNNVPQSGALW